MTARRGNRLGYYHARKHSRPTCSAHVSPSAGWASTRPVPQAVARNTQSASLVSRFLITSGSPVAYPLDCEQVLPDNLTVHLPQNPAALHKSDPEQG
jgi:hypothetical protein